jgi:uncharacterized protein YceK
MINPLSRTSLIFLCLLLLSGCASMISSATSKMAGNINTAIRNQDDPATVRDGAPAYMLMIDGFIEGDPENEDLLLAGSKLYGSYATAFVDDPARAQRLASKSLDYARRALCLELPAVCQASGEKLDAYEASLARVSRGDLRILYAYAVAWAGWVQVNASDWNAVADLAKVTASFERCLQLDETYDGGGAHLYLGVLKSLLPPALGGKPELARAHFERARSLSKGENLMVNVLMARHYARLVYDQELHDTLLLEVKAARADYPGYTLINSLAKAEADQLLAESADFF